MTRAVTFKTAPGFHFPKLANEKLQYVSISLCLMDRPDKKAQKAALTFTVFVLFDVTCWAKAAERAVRVLACSGGTGSRKYRALIHICFVVAGEQLMALASGRPGVAAHCVPLDLPMQFFPSGVSL